MTDIQTVTLSTLGIIVEFLLASPHYLTFWAFTAAIAYFYSVFAALLSLVATLFAWLASMAHSGRPLLQYYQGTFDVMLGRSYRASTLTHDLPANNNVSIAAFGDDMVIAYRKAQTHFASPSATIYVASSKNLQDWDVMWTHTTGSDDLREVLLWEFQGKLFLYFAKLEPYKGGFSSRGMFWTCTEDLKVWSDPASIGRAKEITWDIKVREESSGAVAYKVGYIGNHYQANAVLQVMFECSSDGENWKPVGKDAVVYAGGVCEVSFTFTPKGDLVAIGRNEDGDHTGFGSQLFFASKDDLGSWQALKISIPYRFDSPRMVLMSGEIILFARYAKDAYSFAPKWFPMGLQRIVNLVMYSSLPKSAAVYRIEPPDEQGTWTDHPVEILRYFEECYGDTGFFSVAKDKDSEDWVVANYSSRCHSHAPWAYGQLFATDVYVCRCSVRESKIVAAKQ